jgi:iron-sulfur cluster insertion protein
MTASVTVTDRAAERIAQIVSNESENNMLRVSVEGGGCSGFDAEPEDILIERAGAKVRVCSHVALPDAGDAVEPVRRMCGAGLDM